MAWAELHFRRVTFPYRLMEEVVLLKMDKKGLRDVLTRCQGTC